MYSIAEVDNGIGRLLVELARYINDIKPHCSNTGNIDTVKYTLPLVNKQKPLVQPNRGTKMSHKQRDKDVTQIEGQRCHTNRGTKMSHKRNNAFHVPKNPVNGGLKLPPITPSKPRDSMVTDCDKAVMGTKADNKRRRPSLHSTSGKVIYYVKEYKKSLNLPPRDNGPLSASNVVLCDNNKFATFSHSANKYTQQSQQYSQERNRSIKISTVPPLRSVSANDLGTNEHMHSPSPPLFDSRTKTLYFSYEKI